LAQHQVPAPPVPLQSQLAITCDAGRNNRQCRSW
jgi:hypothetical protein